MSESNKQAKQAKGKKRKEPEGDSKADAINIEEGPAEKKSKSSLKRANAGLVEYTANSIGLCITCYTFWHEIDPGFASERNWPSGDHCWDCHVALPRPLTGARLVLVV